MMTPAYSVRCKSRCPLHRATGFSEARSVHKTLQLCPSTSAFLPTPAFPRYSRRSLVVAHSGRVPVAAAYLNLPSTSRDFNF